MCPRLSPKSRSSYHRPLREVLPFGPAVKFKSPLPMLAMKYGYARVSSKAQDYQSQVEAMKAAGCEKIYSEKQSGKSRNGRPEFAKLMKVLLPGDTVVVNKLDRLARSSRDLHNILHELESLSAGFTSLG